MHEWGKLFQDLPAPPHCGSAAFPLPDELLDAIGIHAEKLGFELPNGPQLQHVEVTAPDGTPIPGAMGAWKRHSVETPEG